MNDGRSLVMLAAESGSDGMAMAGILLFGLACASFGVLTWRGRIAADVPIWQGPGTAVLGGAAVAVIAGAELARQVLDQPSDWWLMRPARVTFLVLMPLTIGYALLNGASWFPDRLLPPHHRKIRPEVGRPRGVTTGVLTLTGFATVDSYERRSPDWEPDDLFESVDAATAAAHEWIEAAGDDAQVEVIEMNGVARVVRVVMASGHEDVA